MSQEARDDNEPPRSTPISGRAEALSAYLDAAARLHAEFGSKEAVRVMMRAARLIETVQAGAPVRHRGRPSGTTHYCPYRLAVLMMIAEEPKPPAFLSRGAVHAYEAFIASKAAELPAVRGRGRKRLAFVLHHAFNGKYGATEQGIVERMKQLEPLVERMKAGDQSEWQAALRALETSRRD